MGERFLSWKIEFEDGTSLRNHHVRFWDDVPCNKKISVVFVFYPRSLQIFRNFEKIVIAKLAQTSFGINFNIGLVITWVKKDICKQMEIRGEKVSIAQKDIETLGIPETCFREGANS